MKDSKLYLIHIRDCLARIKSYTGNGKDSLYDQIVIQYAVIKKW